MDASATYRDFTDAQLLELLATEEDRLTRAAVDEFLARGERMVEPLTRILLSEAAWDGMDQSFWRPIHAVYILAAIGGEKAVPGTLAALRYSFETETDWILDVVSSIFASIGPDAIGPLVERSREIHPASRERWVIIESLASIAKCHPERKDEILAEIRSIAASGDEPEEARYIAGSELLDFALPGDRDLLFRLARKAEKSEEIPIFDSGSVQEAYDGTHSVRKPSPRDWLEFYSSDAIEERQKRWTKEAREPTEELEPGIDSDGGDDDLIREIDETPVVREEGTPLVAAALPGRNDPCPCGSGKKYKKCCGA